MEPVTLEGRFVRLEPLSSAHLPGLCAAGLDPTIWTWMPRPVSDEAAMRGWVDEALAAREAGTALPFAIVTRADGTVAGSTRFMAIEHPHRRLEIGWTWLGSRFQRTAANTEAKLLLMEYAFATMGVHRVEFKTDALNARSRAALLRIGATEEGTLRGHMVTASGRVRDSVYFSVLAPEWPAVRERLTARLAR